MGRCIVPEVVGVWPWQGGGDNKAPRILLELRKSTFSSKANIAFWRGFFLTNSFNLLIWEVWKVTSSVQLGYSSFALPFFMEASLQKDIETVPVVRNTAPWCYQMCHPAVSAAKSRYRQPLTLHVGTSPGWPGCLPAHHPPYGTDQMKCVLSGLQVLTVLY